MTLRLRGRRGGATLVETLVSLVILGIVGGAAMRLLSSQSRFVDLEAKQRSARAVTRASLNLIFSELRMVEASGGVEAASPRGVTVRAPYAIGLSCGVSGGATTVSLLPSDSVSLANASFGGYAWRDNAGGYAYRDHGAFLTSPASAAPCVAAGVTTLPRGRVVAVSSAIPDSAVAGSAIFLFQRLRYEFLPSNAYPGRLGLYRSDVNAGRREEIAAPFDTTVAIRFFVTGSDSSQTMPPANLQDVRGLELILSGESATPRIGRTTPEHALLRTAVFFTNRPEL